MFSCNHTVPGFLNRREMLTRCGSGFGALALSALFPERIFGAVPASSKAHPLAPKLTHYQGKVRNVIFLYMDGGPSQVDTFDPKPRLTAEHGKPFGLKMEPTQFNNNGNTLGPLGSSSSTDKAAFP